jgi:N-acetyl-gamma-glutamyl-phosphate reductase
MRVGIVGASGYAGGELLRLLSNHPKFEVVYIGAHSNAGEEIESIHPHLSKYFGRKFDPLDIDQINKCDFLFLALPHGESSSLIPQIHPTTKIVDLGADFRLSDPIKWNQYYSGAHSGKWSYGLPEAPGFKEVIRDSHRIANPGCYATAINLALLPAVIAQSVDVSNVSVVAASGTTGAGRTKTFSLSASEIMNSITAYKIGGVHQHIPEIEETLQNFTKDEVKISFTPLLAPMPRGIFGVISANTNLTLEAALEIYNRAYEKEKFIHLLPAGRIPETSSTLGSNHVQLQVAVDTHTKRLIICVALDNLGKGAAGQAVQNANLMQGWSEELGLESMGIS